MSFNKSKLRRESKKTNKLEPVEVKQGSDRPRIGSLPRLAMLVPPALYACYLIWDLFRQQ